MLQAKIPGGADFLMNLAGMIPNGTVLRVGSMIRELERFAKEKGGKKVHPLYSHMFLITIQGQPVPPVQPVGYPTPTPTPMSTTYATNPSSPAPISGDVQQQLAKLQADVDALKQANAMQFQTIIQQNQQILQLLGQRVLS